MIIWPQTALDKTKHNHPQLALGDFDADGILDVALALAKTDTITVLWGDGLGGFVRPIKVELLARHHNGGFPISIVSVDLNLDGFWDIVVGLSCAEGKNLVSLLSLGDGTFREPRFYDLGKHTRPVALAVGLFNCDLFPDIAVVNGALANSVSVVLGTFRWKGIAARRLVNIHRKTPSRLPSPYSTTHHQRPGKGDGTFRPPRAFGVEPGLAPQYLAVGDLNGDLHADIVTADALSNDITVLRGA